MQSQEFATYIWLFALVRPVVHYSTLFVLVVLWGRSHDNANEKGSDCRCELHIVVDREGLVECDFGVGRN